MGNNAYISSLIKEAKKDINNKEVINKIIKYYEKLFCDKIVTHYGQEYREKAKEALPELVRHYFSKEYKIPLNDFLRKKSSIIFNNKKMRNFNDIIQGDEKLKIKEYYTNKIYTSLINSNASSTLTNEELYNLCKYILNNTFKNYISSEKTTRVSLYFNVMINRKLELFKSEEKLLLYYTSIFGANDRIKLYFYDKYSYLLEDKEDSYLPFEEIIDEILVKGKNLIFINIERKIIEKIKSYKNSSVADELKKLRCGRPANIELIKNYYSYVKDLVYDKFCDKVTVCKKILKQEIDKKYDEYFIVAINNIINRKGEYIYLPRYINNRLSEHIKNKKSFYKVYYVDDNAFDIINSNVNIINKYVKKHSKNIPSNELKEFLEEEYYIIAYEYFTKNRSKDFDEYVKSKLREKIKKITLYSDSENSGLKKMKH